MYVEKLQELNKDYSFYEGFYFMDFVQELEIELKEYEKVYLEMIRNYVFTEDEINFVKNEIKSLKTILSVLK